ncbi:hypothetical protein [Anthocerotibacter panamensis]|uniref:hypothetical protein n=1 Tax=Anthocerotibacter panamensis TaxID=2857077 RepID=UPI001C401D23|nr:hypothetical protein [Anthocerotibacter panamensis]
MSHCQRTCMNGCILGASCPHLEYRDRACQFIAQTPWDELMALAEKNSRSPEVLAKLLGCRNFQELALPSLAGVI